jgi:aminoglycoside phosphotransferase (APT) family kinase protein
MAVVGARIVDDGFDFKVVVLDEEWVVRIPRRTGVIEALRLETVLLPRIAPELPVQVPSFDVVSQEPPFVVYRLIPGTPLAGEDERGVRAFLEALHRVSIVGLPADDWVETYRRRCAVFRELVFPLLDERERAAADGLFAEVDSLAGFTPSLVHGDLGGEHMLVDGGKLVGVIDWADAGVGDPALDYSWLVHEMFPDWDLDPELSRRASFYYRLAPFYSVHYGVFRKQPDYVERALVTLRARCLASSTP